MTSNRPSGRGRHHHQTQTHSLQSHKPHSRMDTDMHAPVSNAAASQTKEGCLTLGLRCKERTNTKKVHAALPAQLTALGEL